MSIGCLLSTILFLLLEMGEIKLVRKDEEAFGPIKR
jgi:hypothetical protein